MELVLGLIATYITYRIIKAFLVRKKAPPIPKKEMQIEISGAGDNQNTSHTRQHSKKFLAQWYKQDESAVVQGHTIPGGLIYVGKVLLDARGYDNDACLINPELKTIKSPPSEGGDEMGYWPHYAKIPAKCRGAYLQWLAGGRSEPEAYIGYVFLFFYGLERRLLLDSQKEDISEEERAAIIAEVIRLLGIYGDNRSFGGYANSLLATEWVLHQRGRPIPEYLNLTDRFCSGPFQVFLAQYIIAKKPIPADVALQWLLLHPEFGLRTPARRCEKEFKGLFTRRYHQKFGDGLIIPPNKTSLKLEYHAASPSLQGGLKLNIPNLPDPFALTAPLKKLHVIAEGCTVELDAYSRFLGRKDSNPNSLTALALLPKELILQIPVASKMQNYLAEACAQGVGITPIKNLYQILGEIVPPQINKKEAESLALLLEGLGFGLVPDIRFHGVKLEPASNVAIFPHGHGIDFQPSEEFRLVGTILRLGALVSQCDDNVSPTEEAILRNLIQENRNLTGIEKDSLLAFLHWCLLTPQNTTGLKQKLAEVGTSEKIAVSRILVSVAHADGVIDPREVKQLEKLYTSLGLEKSQVTSDLHAMASACEPVTISLRDPEARFSIPQQPHSAETAKEFTLNQELIRIREQETQQVRTVLEGIFVEPVEDETLQIPSVSSTGHPLEKLDQAHQTFFQHLLAQENWERTALYEKCKELGLMIDGAMEVLNEWAFDNANAPLIEDGEPVYVDVNLAREIINA